MNPQLTYPPARKDDVQDDYHGATVPDPYRWLEDPDSDETRAWVQAQNKLTRSYLDGIPAHPRLQERFRALWDYPRATPPRHRNGRYFYQHNDGLQDQPLLYRRDGLQGQPHTLIDPNQLSEDGTIALINYDPSPDGALLAYSLATSGSDWQEIRILNVDSGEQYDEVIRWVKFTSIAWKDDNSGFYYSRYPQPGSMPPDTPPSTHQRLYWHTLGTPQEEDRLVYARPDSPDLAFIPQISADGRYLILTVWHGTSVRNRLYYKPLADAATPATAGEYGFVRLLDDEDAMYYFAGSSDDRFYLLTDLDAPRGRIIAIDLDRPQRAAWHEIVPQGAQVMDRADLIGNHFVVVTIQDATYRIHLYDAQGRHVTEIDLPDLGTVSEQSGRQQDDAFFFHFQSYLTAPGIYRYHIPSATLQPFLIPDMPFVAANYETQQHFYTSADGTRVPLFLLQKKGLPRDGERPTLLYGYGGFAANSTPVFAPVWLSWIEQGGVVAVASLRGGNEYGEEWHQAGMLQNKQNVFDDFIAAAEWLVASGYTRRQRLAIMGRSNGGLLVAACMLQRPDLFGAVACVVPVTDMLRYHRFTAGRYWIPEYGNAEENPDHFRFLYAYSPLHNVRPDVDYPPILITTADTDDRVVPMHAKKLAATLQASGTTNPVLLRVDTRAGHGLGKPTSKVIDEMADIFAFLYRELDMTYTNG